MGLYPKGILVRSGGENFDLDWAVAECGLDKDWQVIDEKLDKQEVRGCGCWG